MTIKIKKSKKPIKLKNAKKTTQKQKQKQTVSVNVNIDQSKKSNAVKRTPPINKPNFPSISLNLPTFYQQPFYQQPINQPFRQIENNIMREEQQRKQNENKLLDFNKNISNIEKIPDKEIEDVIKDLTDLNINNTGLWAENLGPKLPINNKPLIVELSSKNLTANNLSNLVSHQQKTEKIEKEINKDLEEQVEQENEPHITPLFVNELEENVSEENKPIELKPIQKKYKDNKGGLIEHYNDLKGSYIGLGLFQYSEDEINKMTNKQLKELIKNMEPTKINKSTKNLTDIE